MRGVSARSFPDNGVNKGGRALTLELGKRSRCGGIDQGEGQVLQSGVELSVDLQHQAEP